MVLIDWCWYCGRWPSSGCHILESAISSGETTDESSGQGGGNDRLILDAHNDSVTTTKNVALIRPRISALVMLEFMQRISACYCFRRRPSLLVDDVSLM
mmetsp:Transcript_13393/g.21455  ORF Transcript_13393/g.21455 Transcript_13393/m.21455 type:complete len:99 (-) Transcript_13393:24-320(-)